MGFYRGLGPPLATVAAFNAVLFSSRGISERLLRHEDGSPLTLWDKTLAGGGAGFAVSFLATPTELLKCRLQVNSFVGWLMEWSWCRRKGVLQLPRKDCLHKEWILRQ